MYHSGLDAWGDWTVSGHVWLLLQSGYTPDIAHAAIADVASFEVSVSGYSRQALTGAVRVDAYAYFHGFAYGAISPAWTGLGAGQAISTLVLAHSHGSTDTLLAWWDLNVMTDVSDLTLTFEPWQDRNGGALPGGTAQTRLVHLYEAPGLG